MEPVGDLASATGFDSHIGEELERLISVPPETGSSFTALLGLPPNQAMELLVNSPEQPPAPPITLLSDTLRAKLEIVKEEQMESVSNPNSNSSPAVSNPAVDQSTKSSAKRKDREKKVNNDRGGSSKKSKKPANGSSDELPYVHVRARRGQATDSHSLAERARREKINARMKLLQELVPGCDKISGTAMVLDEIINHVQSLQRQVEFLSMRLATVNPRVDFDFDTLLPAESGSPGEMSFPGMLIPSAWGGGQVHMNREQYPQLWPVEELHQPVWVREEDNSNFITPENSLLSYNSSANTVQMHTSQLKMEL